MYASTVRDCASVDAEIALRNQPGHVVVLKFGDDNAFLVG
jgi:hypothetical protein